MVSTRCPRMQDKNKHARGWVMMGDNWAEEFARRAAPRLKDILQCPDKLPSELVEKFEHLRLSERKQFER